MESISLELVGLGRFMESGDESFKKGNLNSIWWFGGHLFWIYLDLAGFIEPESTGESIKVFNE